jgi:hypothetical protein
VEQERLDKETTADSAALHLMKALEAVVALVLSVVTAELMMSVAMVEQDCQVPSAAQACFTQAAAAVAVIRVMPFHQVVAVSVALVEMVTLLQVLEPQIEAAVVVVI